MNKKQIVRCMAVVRRLMILMTVTGIVVWVAGQILSNEQTAVYGAGFFQIGISVYIIIHNIGACLQKYMDVYDEDRGGIYQIYKKSQPRPFWFLIIFSSILAGLFLCSGIGVLLVDADQLEPAPAHIQMQGP